MHFGDRLKKTIINPQGTIGVVTLWSKPDYVIGRFREAGVDLDPATSPIAVFGTLYGNGLRELLRNLLNNPQIQTLLVCGHDRSDSKQELLNFFELGLEPVESSLVHYCSASAGKEVGACRIRETKRILDDLVQRDVSISAKTQMGWRFSCKRRQIIDSPQEDFFSRYQSIFSLSTCSEYRL